MATYEYINQEGDLEDEIYLDASQIFDGLDDYDKRELLEFLLEDIKAFSENQAATKLIEGGANYPEMAFQDAIKKLILNYRQLSQHEENFVINTAKRF